MDIERVKDVVRHSLGLDSNVVVEENVSIASLVSEFDRGDMVDILFESGAWNTEHISDGQVNNRGRDRLIDIGLSLGMPYYAHFASLATSSTKDIFNRLTSMDISFMTEYKEGVAA